MRKIFSILFALVLALSFSLVAAVPVAAAVSPTVTFVTGGTGTAASTADQAHSGLQSAKMTTTTTSDRGMVRFEFAAGELTLDDLTSLGYWEYVSARENPLDVFIDIWLDFDGDGVATVDDYPGYMQAEPYYTLGAASLSTWTEIDAMNLKWTTYAGPDDPYDAPTIPEFQANYHEPCVHGYDIGDWTGDVDFGPLSILRIDIRVGYGSTWANFTGYADDIVINSYTWGFEPTPSEVWVDDDFDFSTPGWGYDHFASIQDGVDAVAGSTVNVAAGTYTEQINITKSLILSGAGMSSTHIVSPSPTGMTIYDAFGSKSPNSRYSGHRGANIPVVRIAASDVVFEGFHVNLNDYVFWDVLGSYPVDTTYSRGVGILVDHVETVPGTPDVFTGIAIRNNKLDGFLLNDNADAIKVLGSATATVSGNTIYAYGEQGISAQGVDSPVVGQYYSTLTANNNTIYGGSSGRGGGTGTESFFGIGFWSGATGSADGNTIYNYPDYSVGGPALNVWGSRPVSFTNNHVTSDGGSVGSWGAQVLGNTVVTFSNNTIEKQEEGVHIAARDGTSPTITMTGNTITNCLLAVTIYTKTGTLVSPTVTATCNAISNCVDGVLVDRQLNGSITMHSNSFTGTTAGHHAIIVGGPAGVDSGTDWGTWTGPSTITVDARYNWWGDTSGPGGVGPGSGDAVSDNVLFYPWLHEVADCDNPSYLLDHFKVYSASGLPINQPVYLEDQFHDEPFEALVGSPVFFGNPAEKEHDGTVTEIQNANDHLTVYNLTPLEGETQTWYVEVYNQFGSQNFTVSDPVMLAVPTRKAPHVPFVGPDHYLLYQVVDGEPLTVPVFLQDQFEGPPAAMVLEPVYFANPVSKDGGLIEDSWAHLVFYKIEGAPYAGEVWIKNQFGLAILDVSNPALLAVPSDKTWYGVPCEAAGTFTSQRYQPGEWDYAISITRTEAGDFVSGTIELTAPDEGKVVGVVEEVKCNYAHWYNHPLVSKPNFAAVGTATYGAWTGNFMFLFADSHIQMVLGEDDYDTEWAAETLWAGAARDYDIWANDGGFWVDCLCPVTTCETTGTFTSQRHQPGEWSYDISITRAEEDGKFVSGTIDLTAPDESEVVAVVKEAKCNYAHWYNHPLVSKPNFAAVGTATYGAWTGNFMFLFADSHIQMVLSEDDYDTEWAAETLWSYGDRDYDIWGDDGDFWVDCLCPE